MPIDGLHHISYTIHRTANAKKNNCDLNYALNSVLMSLLRSFRTLRIFSNPLFAVITSSLDRNSNTWKLLLHILLNGLRRRFTLRSFAVPSAALAVRMPLRSGLIADRQYTPSSTAASGKNFTAASATACGGPGVTIGLLQNLCVAMRLRMSLQMMIFRTVTEISLFDFRCYLKLGSCGHCTPTFR